MCDDKNDVQYEVDTSLRVTALSYGNVYRPNGDAMSVEEVIERAEKFYKFLKGE